MRDVDYERAKALQEAVKELQNGSSAVSSILVKILCRKNFRTPAGRVAQS